MELLILVHFGHNFFQKHGTRRNQAEVKIGDVKDASIDEEKAITFKGGTTTLHSPSTKFQTIEVIK